MLPPPPSSTLFPYTTLFRSLLLLALPLAGHLDRLVHTSIRRQPYLDRKSTRLNSSHRTISYAVFCLKKKTARLAGVFHGDAAAPLKGFGEPLPQLGGGRAQH